MAAESDLDPSDASGSDVDPYRPPANPALLVDARPPHSRLGIAAFVCGAIAIASFAVYVAAAAYLGLTGAGGGHPVSSAAVVAAGGMLASSGSSVFGTAFGVASLFQRKRRRLLGVLGLAASGLVFGFYVVVLSITIAALTSLSWS